MRTTLFGWIVAARSILSRSSLEKLDPNSDFLKNVFSQIYYPSSKKIVRTVSSKSLPSIRLPSGGSKFLPQHDLLSKLHDLYVFVSFAPSNQPMLKHKSV